MSNLAAQRPVAKMIGILVEELGDETVLYDPSTNHFVSLNTSACFVWKRCDGEHDVAGIVAALEQEHQLDDATEVVWLAVRMLAAEGLLEHDVVVPESGDAEPDGRSMSRRTMLGIAAAGLAVPVVASLVAPTPAAALSSPVTGGGGGGPAPTPDVDCVVSAWSNWSNCDRPCGGGTRTRTRSIVTAPSGAGAPCPTLTQTDSCNQQPCPVDCVVSAWSSWSACSASCGGGTQTRSRTVVTFPSNGGAPCPTLTQTQSCNDQPC